MIEELDHIQIAIPKDGEAEARDFYIGVLGFSEVERPAALDGRGGGWFEAKSVNLHLGVQEPFSPALKAHPAFRVASLEKTVEVLQSKGIEFKRDVDLPSARRVFVNDPFGNRIELTETISN